MTSQNPPARWNHGEGTLWSFHEHSQGRLPFVGPGGLPRLAMLVAYGDIELQRTGSGTEKQAEVRANDQKGEMVKRRERCSEQMQRTVQTLDHSQSIAAPLRLASDWMRTLENRCEAPAAKANQRSMKSILPLLRIGEVLCHNLSKDLSRMSKGRGPRYARGVAA